ncbi:MAG: MATE family efflux transporter [Clostridiales bacterium]|nr:MATE family efflux transporter [Clostridiales bacterium]
MVLKKFIGDKAFYHKVMSITIPILIQNVITNFVSLLDNLMVGRLGTEPMSGVAIVNQLLFIFNLCIFGAISGAGIFTAQYHGKGDSEGVRNTFRIKLIIAVAVTAVFTLVFSVFGSQLINLFLHQGKEDLDLAATLTYGNQYFIVMIIAMLPFAISQCYAGTLKETGETVLPMTAGVIAVFVNLLLNYILIYGKLGAPALGVVGAAVATLIARIVECLIVIIWTHRHKEKNPFITGVYCSFRVPKALVLNVVKKGLPLMANEVLWATGMTVLSQCYSVRGLEAISATNISSTVSNLFFCAMFAFGNAISIIVGHLLGSGNLKKAKEEDTKLIFCAVVVCLGVGIIMAVCAPFVPNLYNTTELVKELATKFLLVSSILLPFNAFTNATYFTIRSGGQTGITFVFDSGFAWAVCVPVALILSRCTALPIFPLYAIVSSLDILKCFVGAILLKKGLWLRSLVDE